MAKDKGDAIPENIKNINDNFVDFSAFINALAFIPVLISIYTLREVPLYVDYTFYSLFLVCSVINLIDGILYKRWLAILSAVLQLILLVVIIIGTSQVNPQGPLA